MSVKPIETKDAFDAELKSAGSKLVIVDFYADWCGPCKVVAPRIAEFAQEFKNCVFLKVDVDDNAEVAEDYKISAMPTFKFIKNGKEVEEVVGASHEKVRAKIEQLQ